MPSSIHSVVSVPSLPLTTAEMVPRADQPRDESALDPTPCDSSTRNTSTCHQLADRSLESDSSEKIDPEKPLGDTSCEMDNAFIRSIYPSLHRAAWKMTGDATAAEDVAQDTLVAAYSSWDSFNGRSTRRTWIHGILIRQTRKYFRSSQRLRRRIERYFMASDRKQIEESSDESLATAEWKESIWAKVASLPQSQAEAILLHFGQQLTYEETAQALQCALGTAKSRVHNGLKRLRESQSVCPDFEY